LKKGIALLITVTLVATITALIAVSAGILDNSFKRISNKKFLLQSNLVLVNVIDLLKQNSSDINDSMMLDIFLSMPLAFENKEQDIMVDITFESDATQLNINHYIPENNTTNPQVSQPIENYLDYILTIYNVSDKILLLSMIADTIDMDDEERTSGSEIALENPFFAQGTIYNRDHFFAILDAYKRNTLDYTVNEIPWGKLIGFRGNEIDFNHISPDALSIMLPNVDPSVILNYTEGRLDTYDSFDALGIDAETQKSLEELHLTFFSPDIEAHVNIRHAGERSRMRFSYNLSTQEVSHIEIY
jgi:hypothetical protein